MARFFAALVHRHRLATLIMVAIVVLGLNTLRTIKRDQFPEVDLGEVVITTTYPGASPEDVELNVTNKIEDQLKGIRGIERTTSTSLENLSVIDVVIRPNERNVERVKRDIRDAVARVTDLPEEVTSAPLVVDITTAIIPILEVGVTGEIPYGELREIARRLEKSIKALPGVASVERYGYRAREVSIEADPARLDQYQIPLRDLVGAINARNVRLSGGTLESFTSERNVVTMAQFRGAMEVGDVILRAGFEGPVIRLRDVAVIIDGFEEEDILSRVNGRTAISLVINKTEDADIIRTVALVRRLVEAESGRGLLAGYRTLEDETPPRFRLFPRAEEPKRIYRYGPVQILLAGDGSDYVRSTFGVVLTNGAFGLCFVVVVLAVFLNIRTAFWVAFGIPVAFLGTVALLPAFGMFLDSITLTALILVIGIVVDDGIIISENISRRRELGDEPGEAAARGATEVFWPVVTTVTTTIVAFLPMLFMTGMFGKFVRVIPITVMTTLLVSLTVTSLTLPAHLRHVMEKRARRGHAQGAQSDVMRRMAGAMTRGYRNVLAGFLRFRYLLVPAFVLLLAASFWYAGSSEQFILFPTKAAERFLIYVDTPVGTSLRATSEVVAEVESVVGALPAGELQTYSTRVGTAGWRGGGENFGYVDVKLTPWNERERTADQIIEEIRAAAAVIQGVSKLTFEVESGGPPVGKPVTIRVIGNDDALRGDLTGVIVDHLAAIPGVKDVDRNDTRGKDQVEIRVDHERLARLGLTAADIARSVRIAYDGQIVTRLREADEDVEFRLRLSRRVRGDLAFLRNMKIPNAQGRLIRLGDVAALRPAAGLGAYRHFDGERTTTVTADLDTEVITAIEVPQRVGEELGDLGRRWPGMRVVYGGEAQETAESMASLFAAFGMAVAAIYFLLVLQFNSFSQPLLIMVSVPFAAIGVIFALVVHGEPLSFMGLLGMVGLAGVVVNDAIVLISRFNDLKGESPEASVDDLLAESTSSRVRAIILTTVTTVAGVLPLAYGLGGASLFIAPMALTLGYGLIFSTTLTLILIPCLYRIGVDVARLFRRRS
jgi:multidrug efflux pump subunit AcrB